MTLSTEHGKVARYSDVWRDSQSDPEGFWLKAAERIDWVAKPQTALTQRSDTDWRWFADGTLNVSANALDRHVAAGRGDTTALIYDSAMTGTTARLSYRELRDRVAAFAGALRGLGVEAGDRVLVYCPMTPEAVIAMLACARIGAIHSVVFGGFAANELAMRIRDAQPRVIVTASGGLEPGRAVEYLPLVSRALEICGGAASGVEAVVVRDREAVPGSAADYAADSEIPWLDWDELVADAEPADPVPMRADDPLYILYTSGTTGSPKGIVRDSGGYAVALSWVMQHVYDFGVGDTIFTASDVGWVVGHSFIVYGPLLAGGTTVLYEGKPVGTPDPGAFWRVLAETGAKVLSTAPTALRAIRREDPELTELRKYDLSRLQAVYLAGERMDPETWHWVRDGLGVEIVDHWWQTETGWPICANPLGIETLEAKAGSTTVPMPGFDVRIVDSAGADITAPGVEGNIGIRTPLPPGAMLEIWGSRQRFIDSYLTAFPGYYATGDAGHFDEDGHLFVMGRTDDVINVAGHRLSTGSLEEVLLLHPAIAECAVIGAHDELKGQRAAGFVTVKHGVRVTAEDLAAELVRLVREHIGPVAAFRDVTVLNRLPKTRSGKILRKTMRQIVDGEPYTVPATIEDTGVVDDFIDALATTVTAPPTRAVTIPR
ncbi:AMP-binding protein [Leucobacter luti]|uniref:Propionyl-CoA synthetase n=1 Tax=Leucobacter luti TaxID=340320 RepID=A0A4Q7U0S4_9MICO|nr:AMP-binding protein [Leucobacter luti]MBL3698577.1 propionyl-CoA synthetase [Leucobacter luti]RZT65952.1 propionyl-CoA synthetase [Leucobacter luti]